jgi:hypothetical protein
MDNDFRIEIGTVSLIKFYIGLVNHINLAATDNPESEITSNVITYSNSSRYVQYLYKVHYCSRKLINRTKK